MACQILIVDDDAEFRQEMRDCLQDYQVIEAANGQQALEILKRPHVIDLVILDVVMPGLPGTEVLKQIKKTHPRLSVVMLTGANSKNVVIEALKGHADDYIEKPFQVEQFLAVVQKILDNKRQGGITSYINKMERVKGFIERNIDKKISLNHAADEVCLSPKYLSRLFKKNTGVGFNEYRLKIKMKQAQDLLKITDTTIEALANQLGYKNPESFIRMFEKLMDMTPTQYRLKVRNHKKKKTV